MSTVYKKIGGDWVKLDGSDVDQLASQAFKFNYKFAHTITYINGPDYNLIDFTTCIKNINLKYKTDTARNCSWDFCNNDNYNGQTYWADLTINSFSPIEKRQNYGVFIKGGTIKIPVLPAEDGSYPQVTIEVDVNTKWDITMPDGTIYINTKNQADTKLIYNSLGGQSEVVLSIGDYSRLYDVPSKKATQYISLDRSDDLISLEPYDRLLDKQRGCTFIGWNTAYDGMGTDYDPNGKYEIWSDLTLYAQWERKKFRLDLGVPQGNGSNYVWCKFRPNSHVLDIYSDSTCTNVHENIVLPGGDTTTFLGWYDKSGELCVTSEGRILSTFWQTMEEMAEAEHNGVGEPTLVLTPRYRNLVTVTFESDNCVVTPSSIEVPEGSKILNCGSNILEIGNSGAEAHCNETDPHTAITFLGWYIKLDGTYHHLATLTKNDPTYLEITGDTVLKAAYKTESMVEENALRYVSLGDSIAAGHLIDSGWTTNYGTVSQYQSPATKSNRNSQESTLIVPGTYTALLNKELIDTKVEDTRVFTTSYACSGDKVMDLNKQLDSDTRMQNAIKQADLVTLSIGANELLSIATEKNLIHFIFSGDDTSITQESMLNLLRLAGGLPCFIPDNYLSPTLPAETRAAIQGLSNTLGAMAQKCGVEIVTDPNTRIQYIKPNGYSYLELLDSLYNLNPEATYVFSKVYNPFRYFGLDGESLFRPIIDILYGLADLTDWSIDNTIVTVLVKAFDFMSDIFICNNINKLGNRFDGNTGEMKPGWVEEQIVALNAILDYAIVVYRQSKGGLPNFLAVDTKAEFDKFKELHDVPKGQLSYSDMINHKISTKLSIDELDWQSLWRDEDPLDIIAWVIGEDNAKRLKFWSDMFHKHTTISSMSSVDFDSEGFMAELIGLIGDKLIKPIIDPHPRYDGHAVIKNTILNSICVATFETNGGSPVAGEILFPGKVKLTSDTVRHGYNFGGWYADPGFTQPVKPEVIAYACSQSLGNMTNAGNTAVNDFTPREVTFYAKWNPIPYTIKFKSDPTLNGITVEGKTNAQLKKDASIVVTIEDEAAKKGLYELAKQTLGADYISMLESVATLVYFKENDGDVFSREDTILCTQDQVLNLEWQIKTDFTISYHDTKDCNLSGYPTQYTINTGSISFASLSKPGYTFKGWAYGNGTAVTSLDTNTARGDKKLYAKWEIVTYGITYDLAGMSTVNNNPTSYTVESNYNLENVTSVSHDFLGWYRADGSRVTSTSGLSGDLALTARWSRKRFTLTVSGINSAWQTFGDGAETGPQERYKYDIYPINEHSGTDIVPSNLGALHNVKTYTVEYGDKVAVWVSAKFGRADSYISYGRYDDPNKRIVVGPAESSFYEHTVTGNVQLILDWTTRGMYINDWIQNDPHSYWNAYFIV